MSLLSGKIPINPSFHIKRLFRNRKQREPSTIKRTPLWSGTDKTHNPRDSTKRETVTTHWQHSQAQPKPQWLKLRLRTMWMAGDSGRISNSQTEAGEVGEAVMECDHSLFYCFLGGRRSTISQACTECLLNARALVNQKQLFRSLTDLVWKASELL